MTAITLCFGMLPCLFGSGNLISATLTAIEHMCKWISELYLFPRLK